MKRSSQSLEIRAPRAEDLAGLTAMLNLPGVRHGTLRLPFTREDFVASRFIAPDASAHVVLGLIDGAVVAMGGLFPERGRRAHCGDVLVAVHDDHVGRGHGRRVMTALIDLADNWLGLTRLALGVNVDNAAAIALYESLAFEREGTERASVLRDGRLIDAHIMARLRPAPTRAGGG